MSLPNIVLLGNFGARQDDTLNIDKFYPFALKYYDTEINAHFELKEDLSFTWYQKRNMTANLLKQRPVDTGLLDQYINVSGLGFENEITAILRHGWKNVITDADYPAQANVVSASTWIDIPAGVDFGIRVPDRWNGWPAGYRIILLIVNFNATDNNIKLKLFPDLKEFTFAIPLGGALGFYFIKGTNATETVLIAGVNTDGFKYKIMEHNQEPNIKVFNVKFQEFQDTNIPPSVPASNEIDGNETAIYLFNLTA
jgi:hypothetical protein